jgi:hypothetical protein
VSLFLVAQIFGFVFSQVKYVDSIERGKFKVLEVEGLLESDHSRTPDKLSPLAPLGCFFCGVDSGPVLTFFIWLIGAGVLATIFVLVGSLLRGKFTQESRMVLKPLEAERDDV